MVDANFFSLEKLDGLLSAGSKCVADIFEHKAVVE
jgi:hypothetical protein